MSDEAIISKIAGQDFFDGDFALSKMRLLYLLEQGKTKVAAQQLMSYCRQTRDSQTATSALSLLGGFNSLNPNTQVECTLIFAQESVRPLDVPSPEEFLGTYNDMSSVSEQDRKVHSARLRYISTDRNPREIVNDGSPDMSDFGQRLELLESLVSHFARGTNNIGELVAQASASGLLSTLRLRQFVDRISFFASPTELEPVLHAIRAYPLFSLIYENVGRARARAHARENRPISSSVWEAFQEEARGDLAVSMIYARLFLRLGDMETATKIVQAAADRDHINQSSYLSLQIVRSILHMQRSFEPYEVPQDAPPYVKDIRSHFETKSEQVRNSSLIEERIEELFQCRDLTSLSPILREGDTRNPLPSQKLLEYDHRFISIAGKQGDIRAAFEHYDYLVSNRFQIDDVISAAAIRAASVGGMITEAESIFSDFLDRGLTINAHVLSAMIHCYANADNWLGVRKYLEWTIRAGFTPHARHHFGPAISCCRRLGNVSYLAHVLKIMTEQGVDLDEYNTADAMRTFIDARDSESALRLLRAHLTRHETIDSHLVQLGMEACRHSRNAEYAEQLLFIFAQSGKKPDSFHYGSVIEVCGLAGLHDRARHWYREAQLTHGQDGYLIHRIATSCEHARDGETFALLVDEVHATPFLLESAGLNTLLSCARALEMTAHWQVLIRAAENCIARSLSPSQVAEQFALDCERLGAKQEFDRFVAIAESHGPLSLRMRTTAAIVHAGDGASEELRDLLTSDDTLAQIDSYSLGGLLRTCADVGLYELGRNLLAELASRDSLKCRALGYFLNSLVRSADPHLVESTFRDFVEKAHRNDGDLTILYNLVLKAHNLYGSESDFDRIRLEMIAAGVELDRYFLGAIEQRLGEAAIQGSDRTPLRHSEANEWQMLAIMLDDVVHELSQMVGEIGLLARDISSNVPAVENDHTGVSALALLDVCRRLGERLQEYSAIAGGGTFGGVTRVGDTLEWLRGSFRLDWDRLGIIGAISGDRDPKIAPLQVAISEFHLRLILKVLVKNAVDVLSESRESGQRKIWITAARSRNGRDLLLLVQDNGSGIPDDARQSIFDRGFSTKGGRGLGLGLSLVELVAETVGGRVHLENTSDSGTTFILSLPLREEGVLNPI